MKNFLIILSDQDGNIDWRHPSELNGASKQEVYNLIAQDVPEDHIIDILTADEYDAKYINKTINGNTNQNVQQNISDLSSDQFENGTDFFNAMLQAGNAVGEINNNNNNKQEKITKKQKINKKQVQTDSNNKVEPVLYEQQADIKYFEEGGIKFKLENGILYKKVWKQVLLNGQKMSNGEEAVSEFRLVSAATKKLISVEKVELQRLEWEEVKTH